MEFIKNLFKKPEPTRFALQTETIDVRLDELIKLRNETINAKVNLLRNVWAHERENTDKSIQKTIDYLSDAIEQLINAKRHNNRGVNS